MKLPNRIYLFGVSACGSIEIDERILHTVTAIAGSRRLLEESRRSLQFSDTIKVIPITPLADCFARIESELESGNVLVLASGDPLFFGISRKLFQRFGTGRVEVHPALSSVQYACSTFRIPWDDLGFVSVHGRDGDLPLGEILRHDKVAVLTDPAKTPNLLCARLIDFLGKDRCSRYKAYVAEDIGMDSERFIESSLEEVASGSFGGMCCLLLIRTRDRRRQPFFGLTEQDIVHSRGLITKNAVRASALHTLAIPNQSVFWDVGGGSGSVSIEAARLSPSSLVFCIDKNSEQENNILANIEKFDLYNMRYIHGAAPDCLQGLPVPDRVFIGGSGGHLEDIVRFCSTVLKDDGRIVVSAVLESTRNNAPELLYRYGFTVEMTDISVSRSTYPGGERQDFNPITLILGRKRL